MSFKVENINPIEFTWIFFVFIHLSPNSGILLWFNWLNFEPNLIVS